MKILGECKRILAYGGLGRANTVNIGGCNVPRLAIPTITLALLFPPNYFEISQCIIGYQQPDRLNQMLYPFHLFVLSSLKKVAYFVLILKTDEINELIEYMQMVIDERELPFKSYGLIHMAHVKF